MGKRRLRASEKRIARQIFEAKWVGMQTEEGFTMRKFVFLAFV